MKNYKIRVAFLRDFAAQKVNSGYYKTKAAILDEFKGKVYAYRLQGSDQTPAYLRLKPETISAWVDDARIFARYAMAFFRRSQKEVV